MGVVRMLSTGDVNEATVVHWLADGSGSNRLSSLERGQRAFYAKAIELGLVNRMGQLTSQGRAVLTGYGIASSKFSQHRQAAARLRQGKARYQRLFQSAPVCLLEEDISNIRPVIADLKSKGETDLRRYLEAHPEYVRDAARKIRIRDVNEATLRLYGATSKREMVGRLDKLFGPESLCIVREQLVALVEGGGRVECEVVSRSRQGKRLDAIIRVSMSSAPDSLLVSIIDITERKRAEKQLTYLAEHDALTGLPNRVLFWDRLNTGISRVNRSQRQLALMYLDLDDFKAINDWLGHHVGDMLLKAVAGRLKGCARRSDTVARFGGDEFTLILEGILRVEDMVAVAEKIIKAMDLPFTVAGHEITVSPSIGIAIYSNSGTTADCLLKNADTAMYCAKKEGNRYEVYRPEMGEGAVNGGISG